MVCCLRANADLYFNVSATGGYSWQKMSEFEKTFVNKHDQAVTVVTVIAASVIALWSVANFVDGRVGIATQNLVLAISYYGAYRMCKSGRYTQAATITASLFLAQMAFSMYAFGYGSGAYLFFLIGVLIPYLMFRRSAILRAHIFVSLSAIGFMASVIFQDILPVRYEIISVKFMLLFNSFLFIAALLTIAISFIRIVTRGEEALAAEHQNANDLLLNVLPEPIADRLKAAPENTIADRYDNVSVMFVDIVGFTTMADSQQPEETIAMLNKLFTGFDLACEKYSVEKIRTIGDGYMIVAGAPIELLGHQVRIIETGLELIEIAKKQNINIRIGANCGEVVAGIVGLKRFQYDFWGDTVNIAARMETTGESGKIQISELMHSQLGNKFKCVERGKIQIKGKGKMATWFVEASQS